MSSKRFIRRGTAKFYFLTTAADYKSITRAELTAGTDITDEIADVSGWLLENQSAATPDMGSTFEKSIPGLDSTADSSFTFYDPEEDPEVGEVDISVLMPKGQAGIVVILRRGDKPGDKSMDSFPVRVGSKGSEFSAGNDPARVIVNFTITDAPELDQAIPAATP